jgi:prepilin-type N-terminal cleavage/methylation domain-containing protein
MKGPTKMKYPTMNQQSGFTLAETMIAMAVSTILLAAIVTTAVTLQKSFRAADQYFATHIQQVRIIDYLGRDVKRGFTVTTSIDRQSVTVTLPNYLIEKGDPEALVNPDLVGTPRTPTITRTATGPQVNYGSTLSTVVYAIDGLSILRTENGVVTTIASSTDQLVPSTTNVELANTQFTNTTVTFRPIFTATASDASRFGTTACATAYLRNRRRA